MEKFTKPELLDFLCEGGLPDDIYKSPVEGTDNTEW